MTGDRGFSLVELMVVVVLTGIVGSVTTSVIVTGFHRQAEVDGRAVAIQQVRTALQRTLRDVREAYPLLAFTPTAIALGETNGSTTQTVCYTVVTSAGDTSLQREVLSGTTPCPASPSSAATTVADHLDNITAGKPVFSVVPYLYSPSYQASAALQSTVSSDCSQPGTSPTQYAVRCIGVINVELLVQPLNATTGRSLCPAGSTLSACDIDVADSAEVRNAP